MSGDFKVNFGALDTAAADIAGGGKQLQSRLEDLDRQLAPLRSDWTGAAAENYQQAKAKWTNAINDMNVLLNEIGTAVSNSNQGYTGAESSNKNLWG